MAAIIPHPTAPGVRDEPEPSLESLRRAFR